MNKIDFTQTGGFPIEQDVFASMQNSYQEGLKELSKIGGNNYILSGCSVIPALGINIQYSSGVMVLNNEIIAFQGQTFAWGTPVPTHVIIEETVINRNYEDGMSRPVFRNRVAKLGTGSTQYAFSSLKRIPNLFVLLQSIEDINTRLDNANIP